jgi:hypothetical protein
MAICQTSTEQLADAIPLKVIDRWKNELEHLNRKEERRHVEDIMKKVDGPIRRGSRGRLRSDRRAFV